MTDEPDITAIDAAALAVAAEILTRILPGGECVGNALFKAPMGADEDSLHVNLTTGQWFDVDTGAEGTGLTSLLALIDGCELEDAAARLECEIDRVAAGWDDALKGPVTGPPEPGPGGGAVDGSNGDRPPVHGASECDRRLLFERRNDLGNAVRLIERHGADLMYVPGSGWHVWDNLRWAADFEAAAVMKRCHRTADAVDGEARALAAEAGGVFDAGTKKRVTALFKWATASGNAARLTAMRNQAAPYLVTAIDDLDRWPFFINATNGTIEVGPARDDADCVSLRAAAREDRLTRRLAVKFDPEAACPRFRKFVERILPDAEVRTFVQRYLGYCLTGDVSEQCIMLCYGTGANGKTTLINIVSRVLGDYVVRLPFASLLHDDRRGGADASPDIARLAGARLAVASEPDVGARFSESLLKQLAGGERMAARHLHHEFFEFNPQFKLVLTFNNRPAIRGQDEGIWRRLALVPFEVSIPEADQERRLDETIFAAEGPGVLNWLLDGLRLWREGGLAVPDKVRAATLEYRDDEDPVGQFLAACTVKKDGARVQAKILYDAYAGWCVANAQNPITNNLFGRMMSERGFRREKVGAIFYVGIEMIPDLEDSDTAPPAGGGAAAGRAPGGDG